MMEIQKLKKWDRYLKKLIGFQDTEPVKVITGICRCEKRSFQTSGCISSLMSCNESMHGKMQSTLFVSILTATYITPVLTLICCLPGIPPIFQVDTWRLRCCHSLFGNFLISTTSVCGRLVVPWEGHADRCLIKVENVMICGRYLMPICVLAVCRESQIASILLCRLAHSSGRMDLK